MNAPSASRRKRISGQRAAPGWLVLVVLVVLIAMRWQEWAPPGNAPAPQEPQPQQTEQNQSERKPSEPREPAQPPATEFPAQEVFVKRVVDGDTLLLPNGDRVRLLGVDTPETKKEGVPVQPWGPEASAFTTTLVEGKTVRLEFDRERYDQYQRILAYVYIGEVFVNEEVIRQGFSKTQMQYPYRTDMKKRFQAAEREAQSNRRGIWTIPTGRQ